VTRDMLPAGTVVTITRYEEDDMPDTTPSVAELSLSILRVAAALSEAEFQRWLRKKGFPSGISVRTTRMADMHHSGRARERRVVRSGTAARTARRSFAVI
jgi:hypothetical protein